MNPLILTLAILHSGDAITTGTALSRGGVERNPVLPQSPSWNMALQASETAGELYLLKRLNQRHPKIAKGLAVAAIGVEGFAVIHNIRTLNR